MWNRDFAGLLWVFELPVTTFRVVQHPTIFLERLDDVRALHSYTSAYTPCV